MPRSRDRGLEPHRRGRSHAAGGTIGLGARPPSPAALCSFSMTELDAAYPKYGFAHHKGYSTPEHLEALDRFGPCAIHRRSFAPVIAPRLALEAVAAGIEVPTHFPHPIQQPAQQPAQQPVA